MFLLGAMVSSASVLTQGFALKVGDQTRSDFGKGEAGCLLFSPGAVGPSRDPPATSFPLGLRQRVRNSSCSGSGRIKTGVISARSFRPLHSALLGAGSLIPSAGLPGCAVLAPWPVCGEPSMCISSPAAPGGLALWVLLGIGDAPGTPANREIVKGEAACVTPRVGFAWSSFCLPWSREGRVGLGWRGGSPSPSHAAMVPRCLSVTCSFLPPSWTSCPRDLSKRYLFLGRLPLRAGVGMSYRTLQPSRPFPQASLGGGGTPVCGTYMAGKVRGAAAQMGGMMSQRWASPRRTPLAPLLQVASTLT